ncbi:hypothetical protein Vadar_034104 [Vaccinium darrowii]|uniref:Uncharacterized protein n=1 Tax=Vaccinium darrowii TaxID=229202 RepID=A0ACB7Y598_9ERIC|nr:hypothetical protein Vadar_034104 [Vaccinium darrowii]
MYKTAVWEAEVEQIDKMAKFSVGREEDDSEGPSNPRPKKQRTSCSQPPQEQQDQTLELERVRFHLEFDEEDEEDLVFDEENDEEEEEESEHAEEEEEEEGGGGGGEEEESDGANMGLQSIGDRGSAGPSGDGSISVTLTDPDVLDCPICLEPLNSPVFQCENGHIACSSCCIKLGNKCPSCSWPIGYNRCRAIEKVIESVKISCINFKYGCFETVSYNKKHNHEKTCIFAPCSCPLPECNFLGCSKEIFLHFSTKHSNSAKRFQYNRLFPIELSLGQRYLFLQEQHDCTVFVLNNVDEILGNVVNVICIGPSSAKSGHAYDLIARKEDSSLRLQSFTESVPRWVAHLPLKRFLMVPNDFNGNSLKLKLELCIQRPSEGPAPVLRVHRAVYVGGETIEILSAVLRKTTGIQKNFYYVGIGVPWSDRKCDNVTIEFPGFKTRTL